MDGLEDQIAIVGIGCNFPGGEGIDNFWKVLVDGKNCTTEIPAERFNIKHWYDPDPNKPGKICTNRASFVEGVNEFDHKLFGIHEFETENMDPQQKLLLECTYRALEDGGYPTESISGSQTGVFIGIINRDAYNIYNNCADNINHLNAVGTAVCMSANRISYCFNLTGPSLIIDTACSSFLVALHSACQSIQQGDCEMAICGAVNCLIESRSFVILSKTKMISPDGISKPFSNKADGYGRGEGCGVVILKPLKKAVEDYNKIWGVICKSAINQDGQSVTPITKPSQYQQEKLLQYIYKTIDPCSIQYVEAHGTGTPVGDPIEAASLGNIIGNQRSSGLKPLKIGSVKGNIGHAECASGVAGLIKVLLMMHHEIILPSLHYSKGNGIKIIEESNLEIPTCPEKWQEDSKFGRMAGINNFGFGGTNAHAVVQQYKQKYPQYHSKRPVELFIVSAASEKSLNLSIEDTQQVLSETTSLTLENLVYTAACRRSHLNHQYRTGFLASSLTQLNQQIQIVRKDTAPTKSSPQIVFVLCGNGVLYKGMCKIFLDLEPVFRKKCVEIDEMISVYTSLSVVQLLENEFDDFSRPDVAQLLLFTVQVSLVALLKHWGVKADCIFGHSVGEVAAAHCSRILSLEDAVKVIYYRSALQCRVTGGKMLVVGNIKVTELSEIIASYKGKVCIAAYNSPTSCTVSGDGETIDQLKQKLTQDYSSNNIFLHILDVSTAFHSPKMDPILNEVKETLRDLQEQNMEIDLLSTVTGKPASKGDFTTGDYWARNISEPVAFQQAVEASAKDKENVLFLEIGPRRTLQRNIIETLGAKTIVLSAIQPQKEYETIFSMLITLFTHGNNPNWCNVFEDYKSAPSTIPRYRFDHIKQDIQFEKIRKENQTALSPNHPLIHSINEDFTEFRCKISKKNTPYVYEHKNMGSVLIPGALCVELGLAAAALSFKPKVPLSSLEISVIFSSPCVLHQDSVDLNIKLHQKQENKMIHFEVLTSYVLAKGQIEKTNHALDTSKRISTKEIFQRCSTIVSQHSFYDQRFSFGFEYGKTYRQLGDVYYGKDLQEGIARVKVSEEVKETMYEYHIHPVILDCFLQVAACVGTATKDSTETFLSSIGSLTILQPLQDEMIIYIKTIKTTQKYVEFCGGFVDNNGSILVEIKSAKIAFLNQTANKQEKTFYQVKWTQSSESTDIQVNKSNMLVYSDNFGVGEQLSKYIQNGLSYITFNSWDSDLQVEKLFNSNCKDIVFMWGVDKPTEKSLGNLTQYLAKCCDVYRQLILSVSQLSSKPTIRTVTFRTVEGTVDRINPGFAFIGMTRACVTELPDITFQLIDISSSSPQDVEALAKVLLNYNPEDHPEIWINEGIIYTSEIIPTDTEKKTRQIESLQQSDHFTLHTSEPYKIRDVSVEVTNSAFSEIKSKEIEINIENICAHTDDYFPVSLSSWKYGSALYWTQSEKHELIALDFAGIVTAVGKDVKKVQVGDGVAVCYPVVATSKIRVPENVCYLVKDTAVLGKSPCISFFVLAWEILHRQLPCAKNKPQLAIVTSDAKSILCRVLCKTAEQAGWEVVISNGNMINAKMCVAMVVLPTVEGISREALTELPLLKNVIVLSEQKDVKNVILFTREDIHVHVLDFSVVLQKSYLQLFANELHTWLYSISSEINILESITEPQCNTSEVKDTPCSYSTVQALPIIKLDNGITSDIAETSPDQKLFKHSGVYIVTGGLTGLGFEMVKFILQNGGGNVVILSRQNPTLEMEQQIAEIEKENTKIVTLQCNIANYAEVIKAIDSIQKTFPKIPIRGIFHSAAVFHDGILQNLNLFLFEKVMSPKVDGAVNLHNATKNIKLDYFVCYSSFVSSVGNSGQANYAAANSFLDIFCQYRRNMGLCGQSISWGGLNLGVLLNQHKIQELLKRKGTLLLSAEEIRVHLKDCLLINNTHQTIAKFDFKAMKNELFNYIPGLKKRFHNVLLDINENLEETLKMRQSSQIKSEKPEDYILLVVSEQTGVSASDITMDTLLSCLGVDSMVAMTIHNDIFRDKNIRIPVANILDPTTTISGLVSMLKEVNYDNNELGREIVQETKLQHGK